MSDYYILKNKKIYPCDDLLLFGAWLEENREERQIGRDKRDDILVSTVFLGIDSSLWGGTTCFI